MSSEIKADKWSPASGTSATLGDSGDTYTIPSGATLSIAGTINASSGTTTGFPAGLSNADYWCKGADQSLSADTGTLITGTTDNILIGDIKSKVDSGLSSEEFGFGFSHLWKVTSGNRPAADSGTTYTFDIWSKQPTAAGGGTTFVSGTMMVWEVEE